MDLERALVSKIIFTGAIHKAVARNVESNMFVDDECRRIYEYILRYMRKYGSAPSPEAAKNDNPDFDWLQIQDTIDWVLDRFTVLVKRRTADDLMVELAKAADDPERRENIELEWIELSRRLIQSVPSAEVSRFKADMGRRIDQYHRDVAEEKKPGIPFGYRTLDELTGGLQGHELASVLGFTTVGKSTLLRSFAFNFWSAGYTPLYISLEMESYVLLRIFDAMAASLDYTKIKHFQLDDVDIKNWKKKAKEIQKSTADIPIIDSVYRMTADRVYAETVKHAPDVVILDYVGLMRSSNSTRGMARHEALREITQDLKHYARTMGIPIVMAAQTNRAGAREGAELDNVAEGISISQDSDIVIGLWQDEDMQREETMEIRINKNRDGPRGKFLATWSHTKMLFRDHTLGDFVREHKDKDHAPVAAAK